MGVREGCHGGQRAVAVVGERAYREGTQLAHALLHALHALVHGKRVPPPAPQQQHRGAGAGAGAGAVAVSVGMRACE